MALETKSRGIGANTYRVTQLNAIDGRKLFVRLVKIAGPAFESFDSKDIEASIPRVFGRIATSLTEEDLDVFCDVFGGVTEVTGGEYASKAPQLSSVFALHFAGKYLELLQWLAFCLEVNFGSFFARALGSGAAVATSAPAA